MFLATTKTQTNKKREFCVLSVDSCGTPNFSTWTTQVVPEFAKEHQNPDKGPHKSTGLNILLMKLPPKKNHELHQTPRLLQRLLINTRPAPGMVQTKRFRDQHALHSPYLAVHVLL